jgi:hypothetical protein
MLNFTDYDVPKGLHGGIERWITDRMPPGGFLQSVIANDLREAFARADQNSTAHMKDIVAFFYNEAPSTCWGSPEALVSWCDPKYYGAIGMVSPRTASSRSCTPYPCAWPAIG